jgi:hypothetical protein
LVWALDAPVGLVAAGGLPLTGAILVRAEGRWWMWVGELFD